MEPILNISEWKYLGEGMEHIVLKYIGQQEHFLNKALIIHKQDYQFEYNDLPSKQLNANLLALHLDIISNIKSISEHLLKQQIIPVDQLVKKQFIQDVKKIWQTSTTVRKTKDNNTIDQKKDFIICNNLFQSKMSKFSKETAIIQLKPKSILYTKYFSNTIIKLAEKLNKSFQQIVNIITSAQSKQKTKWFKVCLRKKSNKLSPLDIFNYTAKNYLTDSLSTVVYKNNQLSSLQNIFNKDIYDKMINQSFKNSEIFQQIIRLQLLYNKSYCSFLTITKEDLLNSLNNVDLNQIKNKIKQDLENISLEFDKNQIDNEQHKDDIPISIIKLLISITWRDVSIIVQSHIIEDITMVSKFKQQKYDVSQIDNIITAVKITIIDYNIKPISRASSHPKKEVKILENYLEYKLKHIIKNND